MPVVSNMKVMVETQAGLNFDILKRFFTSNIIILKKEPSHPQSIPLQPQTFLVQTEH